MSDHISINDLEVDLSRFQFATGVAKRALAEVYGLKNCKAPAWGELIAKFFIIKVLDCTGGETLSQVEVDCLVGKLSENLSVNCCS